MDFIVKFPTIFVIGNRQQDNFSRFFLQKLAVQSPPFGILLNSGAQDLSVCACLYPVCSRPLSNLAVSEKRKKIAESIFRIIKCCGFEMSRHLCWTAWVWQPQTYQERKSHGVSTVTATMPVRSYVPFQWGTLMVAIGHELPKDNRSRDDEIKYSSSKRRANSGLQWLPLFTIIAWQ